jgi:hypothetical protein
LIKNHVDYFLNSNKRGMRLSSAIHLFLPNSIYLDGATAFGEYIVRFPQNDHPEEVMMYRRNLLLFGMVQEIMIKGMSQYPDVRESVHCVWQKMPSEQFEADGWAGSCFSIYSTSDIGFGAAITRIMTKNAEIKEKRKSFSQLPFVHDVDHQILATLIAQFYSDVTDPDVVVPSTFEEAFSLEKMCADAAKHGVHPTFCNPDAYWSGDLSGDGEDNRMYARPVWREPGSLLESLTCFRVLDPVSVFKPANLYKYKFPDVSWNMTEYDCRLADYMRDHHNNMVDMKPVAIDNAVESFLKQYLKTPSATKSGDVYDLNALKREVTEMKKQMEDDLDIRYQGDKTKIYVNYEKEWTKRRKTWIRTRFSRIMTPYSDVINPPLRAIAGFKHKHVNKDSNLNKTIRMPMQKTTSNLDLVADFLAQLVNVFEHVDGAVHTHGQLVMFLLSAWHVYSRHKFHNHVMCLGDAEAGKSWGLNLMDKLCIPGTTRSLTTMTPKALAAPGNGNDGFVFIFEDCPGTIIGVKSNGTKDGAGTDLEAMMKAWTTSGKISITYCDVSTPDRKSVTIEVDATAVLFIAMNDNKSVIPDAIQSRFNILEYFTVKRPNSVSVSALNAKNNKPKVRELSEKEVDVCNLLQCMFAYVHTFIFLGLIQEVDTTVSENFFEAFKVTAQKDGLSINKRRGDERMSVMARQVCILSDFLWGWCSPAGFPELKNRPHQDSDFLMIEKLLCIQQYHCFIAIGLIAAESGNGNEQMAAKALYTQFYFPLKMVNYNGVPRIDWYKKQRETAIDVKRLKTDMPTHGTNPETGEYEELPHQTYSYYSNETDWEYLSTEPGQFQVRLELLKDSQYTKKAADKPSDPNQQTLGFSASTSTSSNDSVFDAALYLPQTTLAKELAMRLIVNMDPRPTLASLTQALVSLMDKQVVETRMIYDYVKKPNGESEIKEAPQKSKVPGLVIKSKSISVALSLLIAAGQDQCDSYDACVAKVAQCLYLSDRLPRTFCIGKAESIDTPYIWKTIEIKRKAIKEERISIINSQYADPVQQEMVMNFINMAADLRKPLLKGDDHFEKNPKNVLDHDLDQIAVYYRRDAMKITDEMADEQPSNDPIIAEQQLEANYTNEWPCKRPTQIYPECFSQSTAAKRKAQSDLVEQEMQDPELYKRYSMAHKFEQFKRTRNAMYSEAAASDNAMSID